MRLNLLSYNADEHVFDAPGWLFLVDVSYLVICDSCTDKPLWLDGYLPLVDKLVFYVQTELDYNPLKVYSIQYTGTYLVYFPSLVVLALNLLPLKLSSCFLSDSL